MTHRLLLLLIVASGAAGSQPCAPPERGTVADLGAWFEACPAGAGPDGSAAFQFARALDDAGDRSAALAVRVEGRRALAAAGLEDAALSDALVRTAFDPHRPVPDSVRAEALEAYLDLLALAAEVPSDIIGWHLDALRAVVASDVAERYQLTEGTVDGPGLVQWWRRQDPRPGTAVNERLAEHVARTAAAFADFAPDGTLDARGAVYVRFGPPAWKSRVEVEGGEFTRYVAERVPGLRPSSFPANELWSYPAVDETAAYLFVETRPGGPYKEGTPEDLVPRTLRVGLGAGSRGQQKAAALVFVLDAIYKQLSQIDIRYSGVALNVRQYADVLDQVEREAMLDPPPMVGDGTGQTTAASVLSRSRGEQILQSALPQPVGVFAQTAVLESYSLGMSNAFERNERVPPSQSTVFAGVAQLPVAVRTARFLSPTGQTRTEVMWAVEPEALADDQMVYLGWHLAVQDLAYRTTEMHRRDFVVEPGGRPDDRFPAQAYEVAGPVDRGHLAAEWNLRSAERTSDGQFSVGPLKGLASVRVDSVRSLRPVGLEMSDLKPPPDRDRRAVPVRAHHPR